MNLNKRATRLLTATLVIAAAAAMFFLPTTPQIAQAQVLEEAIELLNTSADVVEEFDQSGADRLRDAARLLADDGTCTGCGT